MEIILPPPSERNPIPSLSAALRVDNYEQVVQLLFQSPSSPAIAGAGAVPATSSLPPQPQPSQFLMFGTESLRTLILRHVLSNPTTPSSAAAASSTTTTTKLPGTSTGSGGITSTSSSTPTNFPNIPRHWNVIGTGVVSHSSSTSMAASTSESGGTTTTSIDTTSIIPNHTNIIITYFLNPTDLVQTQMVIDCIQQYQKRQQQQQQLRNPSSSMLMMVHHRIVYLPQIPVLVQKLLTNAGLIGSNNSTGSTIGSTIGNSSAGSSNVLASSSFTVTLHALSLDLFPIENDVYSMEFPNTFRELHIEGTPSTIITYIARSLLKLQDIVGTIPRIQSYGVASEQVVRKVLDITVEEYYSSSSTSVDGGGTTNPESMVVPPSETVVAMIVLDRKIDMVTPLVTPLTYEGLLDDVVGIENGYMNVNVDIINPPDEHQDENTSSSTSSNNKSPDRKNTATTKLDPTKSKMVTLAMMNETDTMFSEIRDQHVEQFGTYLQQQAKSMQAQQNDFKATGKQKELSELHQFVKQLPHMKQKFQYLTTHIHLAELIKHTTEQSIFRERWQMERTMLEGDTCLDELDDLVAMSYPLYRFLRLLCLQSICKNGINASRYDSIRKDFVQTYGYEFLILLVNLEKAGLLRRKEAFLGIDKASAFSKVKDLLVLINAEVDTVEPDDISYVSSGYAPLTVRLLQSAVTGWKNGRDDILREIPGRFIDIIQSVPPEDLVTTMQRPVAHTGGGGTYGSLAQLPPSTAMTRTSRVKPILIVVYLGGVTYMELTALRFLSKRSSFPYHIICCTTSILNGNTFLQSLA
jgi:vacuolar protein sorting-associated protein 33A